MRYECVYTLCFDVCSGVLCAPCNLLPSPWLRTATASFCAMFVCGNRVSISALWLHVLNAYCSVLISCMRPRHLVVCAMIVYIYHNLLSVLWLYATTMSLCLRYRRMYLPGLVVCFVFEIFAHN